MTVLTACTGERCDHAQRLPAQLDGAEAADLVLRKLPGWTCRSARLLHHPYAGFRFHLEHRPLGGRVRADLHVLVDLRSGAASTSDSWPTPSCAADDASVQGPAPVVTAEDAHQSARQCLMRTVLLRRLSLHHPSVQLTDTMLPLYKPNWLLTLAAEQATIRVLVDALTGGYHILAEA